MSLKRGHLGVLKMRTVRCPYYEDTCHLSEKDVLIIRTPRCPNYEDTVFIIRTPGCPYYEDVQPDDFSHCSLRLLVSKFFLTEQSANFRNQYMRYEELKTGFGISLSQTADLPRFCPRSPRTGSATGYMGRTGANPLFDLEKFRNQF